METITEVLSEETQQEKSDSQFRGVEIPPELAAFPESSVLYPKLLLRVSKPERLRQFGIDDLAFRLRCQAERERRSGSGPDVLKRAGIWYLVASKCTEGSSEVSSPNKDALQEWIPGAEPITTKTVRATCVTCGKKMRVQHDSKFASCRDCRGAGNRRKAAAKQMEKMGTLPEGWKTCIVCADPFNPTRADALYCPKASCRKKAYRERRRGAAEQENRTRQTQVLAELAQ